MKMKWMNVLFGAIVIGGGCLVFASYIRSGDSGNLKPSNEHESQTVVRSFLEQAVAGSPIDSFVVAVPDNYYEESSRCRAENHHGKDNKEANLKPAVMMPRIKDDGATLKELRETATLFARNNFKIASVGLYRTWKDEAIVDVKYFSPEDENVFKRVFFLLIKTENGWKIFMDTTMPNVLNKEFAKHECNEVKTGQVDGRRFWIPRKRGSRLTL
jgi:hypothetical protein